MPTPETSITVESCLAELREMFPEPNWRFHVGFGLGQAEQMPYSFVFYEGQWVKQRFEADSPSALMAQVRAWRRNND